MVMVLMMHISFRALLEGLEEFMFGRDVFLAGPEVGLKVISLLVIEEALFVDDGVDGDEGVLEFVS